MVDVMGRKTDFDPDEFAQVNVRMTKEFKEECDAIAEQEGISLNEWIRRSMRDRLYLATGKDITPDVMELPPIYREIVNKQISKHNDDIKLELNNLQRQIDMLNTTILIISQTHSEEK